MDFSNDPVELGSDPPLADTAFRPLAPAHLRVLMIGHLIGGVVLLGGAVAASMAFDLPVALIGAGVIVVVALSALRSRLEVTHMGWQAREHDLSARRGIIVRTTETLPYRRIQHARIDRGPLQRALGLATLHVNSAGPDLTIPGLSIGDAEQLKALVVDRAGVVEPETA